MPRLPWPMLPPHRAVLLRRKTPRLPTDSDTCSHLTRRDWSCTSASRQLQRHAARRQLQREAAGLSALAAELQQQQAMAKSARLARQRNQHAHVLRKAAGAVQVAQRRRQVAFAAAQLDATGRQIQASLLRVVAAARLRASVGAASRTVNRELGRLTVYLQSLPSDWPQTPLSYGVVPGDSQTPGAGQ